MELLPNSMFEGRFRILRKLGSGAFGSVYEAQDELLKRLVAIKVLNKAVQANADCSKRFLREAKILATVNSNHLVQLFSVSEHDGQFYMVMELANGRTLRDELARTGSLSERTTLKLARGIASALRSLVPYGVVHRDLKPDNVMLLGEDDELQVKVLDLGLASLLYDIKDARLTPDGMVVGSIHYIAPEIWTGDPYDIRGDFYALGCILYECLVGKRPFDGPDVQSIFMQHLKELPPDPAQAVPSLSPQTQSLLARLLQKDPPSRYQSPDELLIAIDAALLQYKAESSGRRQGRFRWKKAFRQDVPRRLVTGALATALVLASLFAWHSQALTLKAETDAIPKIDFRDTCRQLLRFDKPTNLPADKASETLKTEISAQQSLVTVLDDPRATLSDADLQLLSQVIDRLIILRLDDQALQIINASLERIKNHCSTGQPCKSLSFTELVEKLYALRNLGGKLDKQTLVRALECAEHQPIETVDTTLWFFKELMAKAAADTELAERVLLLTIRFHKSRNEFPLIGNQYGELAQLFARTDSSRAAKYWRAALTYYRRSHQQASLHVLLPYADYLIETKDFRGALQQLVDARKNLASKTCKRDDSAIVHWTNSFFTLLSMMPAVCLKRNDTQELLNEVIGLLSRQSDSDGINSMRAHHSIYLAQKAQHKDGSNDLEKACRMVVQNNLRGIEPDYVVFRYFGEMADQHRIERIFLVIPKDSYLRCIALICASGQFIKWSDHKAAREALNEAASLLRSRPNLTERDAAVWICVAHDLICRDRDAKFERQFSDLAPKLMAKLHSDLYRSEALTDIGSFFLLKNDYKPARSYLTQATGPLCTKLVLSDAIPVRWITSCELLLKRMPDSQFESLCLEMAPIYLKRLKDEDRIRYLLAYSNILHTAGRSLEAGNALRDAQTLLRSKPGANAVALEACIKAADAFPIIAKHAN
jgi:serine/threonine protein kinase